ncbi:MAG: tripartite tricarboxylate transporter TctB family protein [Deltaproteobacteria bacterium]|nr:tripartite tricarboxylate transporter TctB family protein [Deltaproteobacteria bacterium]
MRRANPEVLGSLFWIAMGALFLIGGLGLNMGTLRRPGPGFLPVIMAGLTICLSMGVLLQGLAKRASSLPPIAWKRHVVVISSIIGYTLLLEVIGFLLSTFVLMSVLFGTLFDGQRRWVRATSYAAVTAVGAWLVFSVACQVPFPTPLIFRG